jgi:hypothetical protein
MPLYLGNPILLPKPHRPLSTFAVLALTMTVVLLIGVVLLLAAMWEAGTAHAATAHMCTLRKIGGSWVKVCR